MKYLIAFLMLVPFTSCLKSRTCWKCSVGMEKRVLEGCYDCPCPDFYDEKGKVLPSECIAIY
jgi:hypothetical protein